ncbi:transcription factor TFIIIB component B'' homolog [Lucilia sericata]|uniref:transcription factor TFIIIB component B'' homolog n=1 Tax=Lucilia sericata TaxID=13632 RepID=UPI0018A8772C|nr:transcription factor TFIIIB component B'' homolog [Lucilia sericata]
MAMRRPRIKPVANILLNSKRKAKPANDVKTVKTGESDVNGGQEVVKQVNVPTVEESAKEQTIEVANNIEKPLEVRVDTTANENNLNKDTEQNQTNDKEPQNTEQLVNGKDNNNENVNTTKDQEVVANNSEPKEHLNKTHEEAPEALNDSEAFKCPPKVGLQRAISHTSNSGVDDVFYSDIEENALQMDLEKSPSSNGCPMSPSKNLTRQRIRPTPHFGQRRNSFVGSSPSPHNSGNEDNHLGGGNVNNDFVQPSPTRRERHYSASLTGSSHSSHPHYHHTPHKYLPAGITNSSMGRIRTESGCSVFSDTNTSSHKSRKTEDNKQHSRKDFEARFHNGVPEKSAIKMSDLIYYNPATNPMEQKPNPSVKLEQSETSTSDVKPFAEKVEKDTDNSAEGEAVPVPQLKLNAKGELILDDKSLVIETTAEQEARKVLANSSLIYLDENTGMNGFYSRQKRTREWLPAETIKFYRCLQNVGTDFSLMVSLFPNRTRRDLKLKFKKEERKNCHLINKALLYPKQFDLESLKQQIDEEEKMREEQAKKAKATKEKKESKKRKIFTQSIANRVLLNEDIYQNENEQEQKPKRVRKTKDIVDKSGQNDHNDTTNGQEPIELNSQEINPNETEHKPKQKRTYTKSKKTSPKNEENEDVVVENNNNNNNGDIETNDSLKVDKVKRRRRRTPNKTQKEEIIIIKEEIIKIENKQESNSAPAAAPMEYQDTKQLQTEIDELLDSDAVDIPYGGVGANTSYETTTANNYTVTSQVDQYNEQSNTPPVPYTTNYEEDYCETESDINKYEHRTFVNLDDGSVNVYSKIKDDATFITPPPTTPLPSPPPTRSQTPTSLSPTSPPQILPDHINYENDSLESTETTTTPMIIPDPEIISNDTCSSVISERELNEEDIQSILTELAEGSLVLVSSLDPDDPDKVLNEIYMVDKNTGELCEEPLNIPDNIVQCILTVVS